MGKLIPGHFGKLELKIARQRYDLLDKLACDAFWQTGTGVSVHDKAAAEAFERQLASYDFYKLAAIFVAANRGYIKSQIAKRMVELRLVQMVEANNDQTELYRWKWVVQNHSEFCNVEDFIRRKLG